MRIDKYLKVSRIIKRRTVAKKACLAGRVKINGDIAKPSSEVKKDDIIEIEYGDSITKYKILKVDKIIRKENAENLYEIL